MKTTFSFWKRQIGVTECTKKDGRSFMYQMPGFSTFLATARTRNHGGLKLNIVDHFINISKRIKARLLILSSVPLDLAGYSLTLY
jgi:hypothetical protein